MTAWRTRLPSFGVLALAAALGLAACSSSPSAGSAPGSPAAAPPVDAARCGAITSAQINSALGLSVGSPSVDAEAAPVNVCTFVGGNPSHTVVVRYNPASSPSQMSAEMAGFAAQSETATVVPGLGDQAFSSTLSGPSGSATVNTVVVLKGTEELEVSAPAELSQVESLVRSVLP